MKRCALVVRVSTDRQASNPEGSLKTQMEALREFLRYKQTVGDETWVESGCYELKAISGKDSYRSKEFAQLFAAIRAGQVNVVVCTALDRICRSVRDFLNFFEILNEHGVEFVCLKQNYDTTSPQGRLFITMMMALAQFEREQTAERTRDSVRARAGRGLWNGGQLLGYDLDPSKKGTLIPNEAEVVVVRFAFDAYLRTGSILETVKEMNVRGYRTKAYESRRGKHHPAKEFTYNVVRWLLRNHAYIGMKELNKTRGNGELQEKDEVELVEAVWPGIVEPEVFDAVQEQLAANARTNGNRAKSVRHNYLFNGGLLWCAECGTQMEGRSGTGSKGKKYYYYVCRDRLCRLKVRADELEQTVLDRLGELAEEPDILDGVVAITNEELRKRAPDLAKERASLGRELENVQGQAAGLLEQLVALNGSEAGRFARERLEELGKRRQQIEAAIVDVENSLERAQRNLVSADHVRAALANVREVFAGLNPKQQKDVVRLIVARIEAGKGQMSLALHGHPPDLEALARSNGETAGAARFPPLNWLPE